MSVLMRQEIAQQPEIAAATLAKVAELGARLNALKSQPIKRVLFVARGTSDNVAAYGMFLVPIVANIEAYSLSPSLLNSYETELDLRGVLVIAISQSGETAEIVQAAASAKALGAKVLAITNNKDSSLEKVAEVCLVTPAGNEQAVPATKTYTSALVGLAAIVAELFDHTELQKSLSDIPAIMASQLRETHIDEKIIDIFKGATTAVFAGRGLLMGGAFEAALKLKETCSINAIGTSVADFVHGPIAALSPSVPLVIFSGSTTSPIYEGLVDLIKRASVLGAPIITLGAFNNDDKSELHISASVNTYRELVAPLLVAVPSQLLAASVADAKGLDADSPVGLRKITQTA